MWVVGCVWVWQVRPLRLFEPCNVWAMGERVGSQGVAVWLGVAKSAPFLFAIALYL